MPFYEYECGNCKFYSEVMQKISDAPLRKCPSCGKNAFKRLISAPVFRLKGSGWYETDFKSDKESKRNLAGEDKEPAAKAEAKSDAKPDAKADAKPEPKAESKGDSKRASKPAARKAKTAARAKAPARKKSK